MLLSIIQLKKVTSLNLNLKLYFNFFIGTASVRSRLSSSLKKIVNQIEYKQDFFEIMNQVS